MRADSTIRIRRLAGQVAFACCVLLIVLIAGVEKAAAQELDVSPPKIVVEAMKDVSPPTATFYLTPSEAILRVELLSRDLEPVPGSDAATSKLKASQITFAPATLENLEADTEYRVIVTVGDLKRPGAWSGAIPLRWRTPDAEGSPGSRREMQVDLEVRYQTRPTLALSVPPKVVVHGTVGDSVVKRFVVIQETAEGSGATGLAYSVEPLMTEDLERMLPPDAVHVGENPPTTVASSRHTEIPIEVDLHGAKAGAFAGHLVVSSNAADLKIPVEIKVRRGKLLAILVLLSGVLLAWFIPWYRTRVQPKDEVRVRIGALEEGLAGDGPFDLYCGDAVRNKIAIANLNLAKDDFATAKTALDAAEAIWMYWRVNRSTLVALVGEISGLRSDIAGEPEFAQLQAIRTLDAVLYETLGEKIPDHVEAPNSLRELIDDPATGWRPTVETGLELFGLLRSLKGTLPEPEETKRRAIEAELETLPTASVTTLRPLLERTHALEIKAEGLERRGTREAPQPSEAKDEAGKDRMLARARRAIASAAGKRLRNVRFATWILAIAMLVVVGLDELYLDNPTFGADWLSDYFGLFLWGFGAEAGRAHVVTLIKGWGVPTSSA